MSLEKCCHAQLMADAAAGGRGHETIKINDDDAASTCRCLRAQLLLLFQCWSLQRYLGNSGSYSTFYNIKFLEMQSLTVELSSDKTIGTPVAGWFSAKPTFDVIEKECGGDYLQ